MKKIEELTRGQMAWALTQLLHWAAVPKGTRKVDENKDLPGCDAVDVLVDVLDELKVRPKDGEPAPWIVGWCCDGRQYCVECRPEPPESKKSESTYPILKGDPDWGEGSVPVCKDCGKEIFTLFEFPNPKG